MKIHLLSDLHLEEASFSPRAVEADVVVLAGDIATQGRAVAWARASFSQPVLFVPGNHDFYGGDLDATLRDMRAQAKGSNVHVLDNDEVVLGGVRFLGVTLWTDYRLTGNEPLAQWDAQQTLKDFKAITEGGSRALIPSTLAQLHAQSCKFLLDKLCEPFAGKTVVLSHHAPTELSLSAAYRQAPGHLNSAFASHLDRLMGAPVALWLHGHTHDSVDLDLYGTRVRCNPRGCPGGFNEAFDPELVLTV